MPRLETFTYRILRHAAGALASRKARLRVLSHARRVVLLMLPLGALMGLMAALALRGLEGLEGLLAGLSGGWLWGVVLPGLGLGLTAAWLHHLRVGAVSLGADLERAHLDPVGAFPFWTSLAKAGACILTVASGASAGVEGPAKWVGSALGVQVHLLLKRLAGRVAVFRRLLARPGDMVAGGAAGALAAVFRAPLTGALLAAEKDGVLGPDTLVSALVAAASGYLAFTLASHRGPLLPLVRPVALSWKEVAWAVPLGFACGLGVGFQQGQRRIFRRLLGRLPLPWRGTAAGLGLAALALPGALLWSRFLVTQGGGLVLVGRLLEATPALEVALAFFFLRTAATALTFEGGGVGGTWLPGVAAGAALGAAFEALARTGHPGLMAMLGATAFTGAAHGTLLVPVVFLAETTAQAPLVVPGLVATTMAFLVAREDPGA